MTLYVTDLDGTLLNNGSFVSPRSAEIISEISRAGALVTVATARTPATVVPLMEGTFTRLPYIVMTGAAMYSPADGRYSNLHSLTDSQAAGALGAFNRHDVHPFVYHLGGEGNQTLSVVHEPGLAEDEDDFYRQRAHLKLKRFTFRKQPWRLADTILLFASGPSDRILPLAEELRSITGSLSVSCYPDIFRRDTLLIEVFAPGVSKAAAITRLAADIGAERIVAFGDNINDIPMFEVADLSVAVANAVPAARKAADIVIGPNFDDSVAKFIAEDFEKNY